MIADLLTGHEIEHEGIHWMLLSEVRNDCYFAIKVSEPHPRMVYFIHVSWDENEKVQAVSGAI